MAVQLQKGSSHEGTQTTRATCAKWEAVAIGSLFAIEQADPDTFLRRAIASGYGPSAGRATLDVCDLHGPETKPTSRLSKQPIQIPEEVAWTLGCRRRYRCHQDATSPHAASLHEPRAQKTLPPALIRFRVYIAKQTVIVWKALHLATRLELPRQQP